MRTRASQAPLHRHFENSAAVRLARAAEVIVISPITVSATARVSAYTPIRDLRTGQDERRKRSYRAPVFTETSTLSDIAVDSRLANAVEWLHRAQLSCVNCNLDDD
jgi:hypothetical protein